jgi:prevent-host-death family protein
MTTISAKELRDNLENIVERLRAGERIRVTYRSKPAFTLEPEFSDSDRPAPGSSEAIDNFVSRVDDRRTKITESHFDPSKSIKELYHDSLDNDPKYKPPYNR